MRLTGTDTDGNRHDAVINTDEFTAAGTKTASVSLPSGSYTLTPVSTARYTVPAAQTIDVSDGNAETVSVTYTMKNYAMYGHSDTRVNKIG